MKPRTIGRVLALLTLFFLLAASAGPAGAGRVRYVSIAGGPVHGSLFPMAGAVARVAQKPLRAKGIRISAESSESAVANARLVGSGDYELGLLHNVIGAEALRGAEEYFREPVSNLTAVCSLAPLHVQILARKEAGIETIADLRGKRVGVGLPGSGTQVTCRHVLEAWGLDLDDLDKAVELRAAEAVANLQAGRLDAAFFTRTLGDPLVSNAAATVAVKFLPLEGPGADKLRASHPGYQAGGVEAGTYEGQDVRVPAMTVAVVLAARAELDREIVSALLESIFGNLAELGSYCPGLEGLKLEKEAAGVGLPWHGAAAGFFRDKGLLK